MNANVPEAFYRRGLCYEKMERISEAVLEYDKVIELILNDSRERTTAINDLLYDAYFSKGFCLRRQRLYDDAIKAYLHCVDINRNNEVAYFQIGILYMKANQSMNAIDYFNKTIALNR